MSSTSQIASSFVEGAPPGELSNVITDIKALTPSEPGLISTISPALRKYHEAQFSTVTLPGSSSAVVVSPYNSLGGDRYFDTASNTAFDFDPVTQKASNAQSHTADGQNSSLIQSLSKALQTHAQEHYPASAVGVFPAENDSRVALVLVSSKYSPNNFWNGRWRAHYLFDPASGSVSGAIRVDVHYYEDGNVRLLTDKAVSVSASASAPEIVREIAKAEKKYQQDLNQEFTQLNEGAFKGLRRQLPVTRQKVEWEKISGYRLGQDIGGGRTR